MQRVRQGAICKAAWFLSILILICYPLRHVGVGVDLWDGGYNYANFRYSSLEYMDSMWYFATWLANMVGSLCVKLPFGNTMIGMNIYTGLIVSIMATVSYFFCVKVLHMHALSAFVGEMAAITLCWAPTAALYNYLTYLFLLVGTCLLYQGLMREYSAYLIAAGAVLGLNVGNRFSNLVQMGLILAVWLYGLLERKKAEKVLKETGFCILGYISAICIFLLWISFQYGIESYAEGIRHLFQMTENATDYTPGYMLIGMVGAYYDNTYWSKRFLLIFGLTFLVCLILPKKLVSLKKAFSIGITLVVMGWLWKAGFGDQDYATYNAIYAPCVMMFEVTLLLALAWIFRKSVDKGDRLLALLFLLTISLTSLGGNNAMYSSINNTFLVAPGFLWMSWRYCREQKEILAFPVKCVLFAVAFFVLIQCVGFGRTFVYEEATGGRNMETEIQDIPVLAGMRTGEQKAEALTGLYQHLASNDLLGRKCILYGNIPGVSYYMELAPAINIWSDLRSYALEIMKEDLSAVRQDIFAGKETPLIILEKRYASYVETRDNTDLFYETFTEQKMLLICEFMQEYGYEISYENDKFVLYEVR